MDRFHGCEPSMADVRRQGGSCQRTERGHLHLHPRNAALPVEKHGPAIIIRLGERSALINQRSIFAKRTSVTSSVYAVHGSTTYRAGSALLFQPSTEKAALPRFPAACPW